MVEEFKTEVKRASKSKPAIESVTITEYENMLVVCSKCGDKIRTDLDNKVYCPNGATDCPLTHE